MGRVLQKFHLVSCTAELFVTEMDSGLLKVVVGSFPLQQEILYIYML